MHSKVAPAHKSLGCTSPARGWIYTARFASGGAQLLGCEPGLTVHAINPERGTDWTIDGRMDLLRRALTVPTISAGEPVIFLLTAGFFGCCASIGNPASSDVGWLHLSDQLVARLRSRLLQMSVGLPSSIYLAIGVDAAGNYEKQEIWWLQGGCKSVKVLRRIDKPRALFAGTFKVLPFVCGAIFGDHGVALDPNTDLKAVDVVLDAGHASLNRVWGRTVSRTHRRWAFQRTIASIGRRCGAVFAHAHGRDIRYVRNCDNWVVYRGQLPFPEPRTGEYIP